MVPLPTIPAITLPPITWTGICAGVFVTTILLTGLAIWFSIRGDKKKAAEGIPFEEIAQIEIGKAGES